MEFRRSGQRDDRRRRVLREENLVEENTESAPKKSKASRKSAAASTAAYSSSALRECQPLLLDVAPTRPWTLLVIFLLGASTVVGLIWLHAIAATWLPPAPFGSWDMFDASRPNSLVAWFSSSLLLAAAFYAVQVYLLRRHRLDDYRGRYRVWLWTAAFLVLASAAASTSVHEALNASLHILLGPRIAHLGDRAALLLMAPLAAAWFVRLAVEMRNSTGGLIPLALSAAAYAVAVVLQTSLAPVDFLGGWFGPASAPDTAMTDIALLVQGAGMASRMFFLFGILVYCRRVVLESQGLLTTAPRTKSRQLAAKKKTAAAQRKKDALETPAAEKKKPAAEKTPVVDKKVTAPQPKLVASPKKTKPEAAPAVLPFEGQDTSQQGEASLSKAERRRLRKLKRRENRAA